MARPPPEAHVFHVALAAVALPVLSLPLVWAAAIWAVRRARITRARTWPRRFLALAGLDTLVALAVVGMLVLLPAPPGVGAPAPPPGPVIGVSMDAKVDGGVRVTPREGSPAEAAGVRPGDVVLAVDGEPTPTTDALRAAVVEGPIAPRTLRVRRGGDELELAVTPTRGTSAGTLRPGSRGLFVPTSAMTPTECAVAEVPQARAGPTAAFLGVALALLVLVGFVARGHRPVVVLGAAVVIFALATLAGSGTRASVCAVSGGHAPGGLLLGLLAHGVALALGGAWLARRHGERGSLLDALPRPQVYAQSLFYALAWVPRVAIVSWGLLGVAGLLAQTGSPLEAFTESELGVLGVALLMLGGALLGPLAEELLFRGALLPWLARATTPWRAIALSGALFGALHVHHGPSIVGPVVLGMILGWARARSEDLVVPVLLHVTFNTAALSMLIAMSR